MPTRGHNETLSRSVIQIGVNVRDDFFTILRIIVAFVIIYC